MCVHLCTCLCMRLIVFVHGVSVSACVFSRRMYVCMCTRIPISFPARHHRSCILWRALLCQMKSRTCTSSLSLNAFLLGSYTVTGFMSGDTQKFPENTVIIISTRSKSIWKMASNNKFFANFFKLTWKRLEQRTEGKGYDKNYLMMKFNNKIREPMILLPNAFNFMIFIRVQTVEHAWKRSQQSGQSPTVIAFSWTTDELERVEIQALMFPSAANETDLEIYQCAQVVACRNGTSIVNDIRQLKSHAAVDKLW